MSARTVVVTGASAGVGRAAARAFAHNGDNVALLARGSKGLEAARKQQRDVAADPHRPDDLFASMEGDHAAHGSFDVKGGCRANGNR